MRVLAHAGQNPINFMLNTRYQASWVGSQGIGKITRSHAPLKRLAPLQWQLFHVLSAYETKTKMIQDERNDTKRLTCK